MAEAIDRTGMRQGKLNVVREDGRLKGNIAWLCQCDCGKTKRITSHSISAGIRSCGCLRGTPTHGLTRGGATHGTPTYSCWKSMNCRKRYPYYRNLGISVCERWSDFSNFLADMGERPSMAHTIDRFPNKLGNYEPGNCRWATKREQANNRVTNVVVEYKGQEFTMAELSRHTGLPKELLRHRICRANWPVELAVSEPKQQGSRKFV